MLFMRAPAELARLRTFTDESVHRPRIHEFETTLPRLSHLRVTFSAMDRFDPELHGELRPRVAGLRRFSFPLRVACDVEERLLDPVRNETGVRTMGGNDRWAAVRIFVAQSPHGLA